MNRFFNMTASQMLALTMSLLMLAPTASMAQAPQQLIPASAPQTDAERAAREKQTFEIPRLLTVWDKIERELTPAQMDALKLDDAGVKTPDDVVKLFIKHYPSAYDVVADPQYTDPANLTPARNSNDTLYSKFMEFRKWRTNPVGPEVKDMNDLRRYRTEMLRDLDNTPLEKSGVENPEKVRTAWKRRTELALDWQWPWALGTAKIDVLSPVHKMGTYKKKGQIRIEVGMLNRLKGKDAQEPVLRLWLSEVAQVVELAYKCRNGFIVQLDVPTFQSEVKGPACVAVKCDTQNLTAPGQIAQCVAQVTTGDPAIGQGEWKLIGKQISIGSVQTTIRFEDLQEGKNVLAYHATSKLFFQPAKETEKQGPPFEVNCATELEKRIPPPPPPTTPKCESVETNELLGRILVKVRATPLKPNQRVEVRVDGKPLAESDFRRESEFSYSFNKGMFTEPGTHRVTVAAFNADGTELWKCGNERNKFIVLAPPKTPEVSKRKGCGAKCVIVPLVIAAGILGGVMATRGGKSPAAQVPGKSGSKPGDGN